MPDSSSKSGSPRQPSSRPPFSRDWLGIRFSSWNAGFQLEKRIPQDNLHHGPLSGGIRAGMPDSSSKSGSPRQPLSRPPFRKDWLGIRFSSWNAGFQLEKRISKTTFITAPFQEGLAGDPLFELECRIPARKADAQDNLHHGPLSAGIGGSAFRAGTKTAFITAPFQEGLAGDPLFELECRIPARKADPQDNLHHGPLSGGIGWGSAFRADCRIPARKADPQDNLHHGPLSGGVRFFRRDCALFFRTFGCFFSALRGSHVFRAQRQASIAGWRSLLTEVGSVKASAVSTSSSS